MPRTGTCFTGVQGGWEVERGDWKTDLERELLLAVGRWTEGGNPQQGMPTRKTGLPWKQGAIAESCRGRSHYCNLSLPTHQHWLPSNLKSPLRAGPHLPYAGHQKRPSLGHISYTCGCRLPCEFGAAGAPEIQTVIPHLHPVLTGAEPRAPRQPQDQTPVGGTHAEVGIKPN